MSRRPPGDQPYRSARDLPSVAEMLQLIEGGKLLTRVIARRVRPDLVRLERQVEDLADLVDRFYVLLGDRSWIFHEHLNVEAMRGVVKLPADEAERALIEMYKVPEFLGSQIRMAQRFPAMRVRMHLVQRAADDYLAGRYYATVLTLLTVMDGFVNDLESQHRGLHARADDEMHAWDSIVGHHMGLTNAHKSFRKRFSRISDEPVTDLYRNGILHGNLVNFDNDVVATKAWNRLFAVLDWATALKKRAAPQEPKPTMRELLKRVRENEEAKKALAEWRPSTLGPGDAGFSDDPVHQATQTYLEAWEKKNYGEMSRLLSSLVAEETHGRTAGMVREAYEASELSGFSVHQLDHPAAAVCEVDVELDLRGESKKARLRWIREGADGMAASPNQPGEWRLVLWTPQSMLNRARSDS